MSNLFVYITNSEKLHTVNYGNTVVDYFRYYFLIISDNKSHEAKMNLTEDDKPQALLVNDDDSIINCQQLLVELSKIALNYEKIYIAYHEQGAINGGNERHLIIDKSKFILSSNGPHTSNNYLYKSAIAFIKNRPNAAQSALEAFTDGPLRKKKLEFLHRHLGKLGFDTASLDNEETLKKEVNELTDTDSDFKKKLKSLRDKWLQ